MNPRHVRLLLWLRVRLMFRSCRGGGRLALMALGLLVLTSISVGLGWEVNGITRWLATAEEPARLSEWTHLVCFLVFLFLVAMPVLGLGASEFYDITKLFHLPVSHRSVFVGQAIGMSFSGTSLFFLPTLLGLAAGLPGAPLVRLLRIGGALLLVFHAVAVAQLLQLGLLNLLRSRRFREFVPVVAAVLSGLIYFSMQFVGHQGDPRHWIVRTLDRGFSDYLAPLPVYWFSGFLAPGAGTARALLFFLGFLPFTALVVILAGLLQEKAYYGEVAAGPKALSADRRRARAAPFPFSRLPDAVRAVMGAVYRILRREPSVRVFLIQQFIFFLIPVGAAVFGGRDARVALTLGVYALLLVESGLILNLFGPDGPGIVSLFMTPLSRRRILWGKIAAAFFLWFPVNLVVLGLTFTALALVSRAPRFPGLVKPVVESLTGLLVLLGIGAMVSVASPMRFGARNRRALSAGQVGEGCFPALLRMLSLLLVTLLLTPLIVVSRLLHVPAVLALGPPYGFLILWFGVSRAARRLERSEEKLIDALAASRS